MPRRFLYALILLCLYAFVFSRPVSATSSCSKLGVNLAVTVNTALPLISQANSLTTAYTEFLVTSVDQNDLVKVVLAIKNSTKTIILRLGAGVGSENISATDWGNFLNNVYNQAQIPFIATAGHNEPNCDEYKPLAEEKAFVEQVARIVTNPQITLITGQLNYTCTKPNVPPAIAYRNALVTSRVHLATALYTDPGYTPDQAYQALIDFINGYSPVYLTEIGAKTGGTDSLLQLIAKAAANPQIVAVLIFNGLCANPDSDYNYSSGYCTSTCLSGLSSSFCQGSTPTPDQLHVCQAPPTPAVTRDSALIYSDDPIKIASSYVAARVPTPTTKLTFGDDLSVCEPEKDDSWGCITDFGTWKNEQEVKISLPLDNAKIPWFSETFGTYKSKPTTFESRVGSGSTLQSEKRKKSTDRPELAAPIYKATTRQQQFAITMRYLARSTSICRNYPYPPQKDTIDPTCPLQADLEEYLQSVPGFADPNNPIPTDLIFFEKRLASLFEDQTTLTTLKADAYETFQKDLSAADQQAFWKIKPQTPDGVEFHLGYWVIYTRRPKGDKLKLLDPDDEDKTPLQIVRFIIPVNVGEQANQTQLLNLQYTPDVPNTKGFLKSNENPPLIQTGFTNSPATIMSNLLKPYSLVKKQQQLLEEKRQQQLQAVMAAPVAEACIHAPDVVDPNKGDPLAEVLVKLINSDSANCKEVTASGETSDKTYTPAQFAQPGNTLPLPGLISSLYAALEGIDLRLKAKADPLKEGEDTAEHRNFIIYPGELEQVQAVSQDTLTSFLPKSKWDRDKTNDLYTPYYQIPLEQASSPSLDCTYIRIPILGTIIKNCKPDISQITDPYVIWENIVGTSSPPMFAKVLGAALPNHFTVIGAGGLLPKSHPLNFFNTQCSQPGNILQKTDCYWKNFLGGLLPGGVPPGTGPGTPLPTAMPQGCFSPQPFSPEIAAYIAAAKRTYPDESGNIIENAASKVPDKLLMAIHTIESQPYWTGASDYTCTVETGSDRSLGLMQLNAGAYFDYGILPPSQQMTDAEQAGNCNPVTGKLNRCYAPDSMELAARLLLAKTDPPTTRYNFVGDADGRPGYGPAGTIATIPDIYESTSNYYGTSSPTQATANLASFLVTKGLLQTSDLRNQSPSDMSYSDIVCALMDLCPPYPSYSGN